MTAQDCRHVRPLTRVLVTPQELIDQPVNRLIYGSFIESGLGRQVDQMWAELLWNRSFEEIPPLRDSVWGWLDRAPDTDLTEEAWWHSGYEEHDWRAVSSDGEVSLQHTRCWDFRHGVRAAVLRNESGKNWASLTQYGVVLRPNTDYDFSGWVRHGELAGDNGHGLTVRVGLYPEGRLSEPMAACDLTVAAGPWQRVAATLCAGHVEGRATLAVSVPPGATVLFDGLSLRPADHVEGWRADVVQALRRVNAPIIRWPGGCFASFYNWRDGVGPSTDRRPRESDYWGGLEMNDVGTVEFVRLCRLVGAEPLICANVMTGSAYEAAEWVAYCNTGGDHPVGGLRAKHGHPEPLGVKYWELDNEPYRRFGALEYAERCAEFAQAMKAVDPRIRLVMVGYWRFREYLLRMLDIAGPHIDLITDRGTDEEYLRGVIADIEAYNARAGADIRLCNTEWLAPTSGVPVAPDALNRQPDDPGSTLQDKEIRWAYAINAARQLLLFQRLGGRFEFANFNNMANTWGQNLIECPKEGAFLSAAGRVFELLSRSPAAWPLRIEGERAAADLDVQVAWDDQHRFIVVTALSYSGEARGLELDLSQVGLVPRRAEVSILSAASLAACNTVAQPEAIAREDRILDLDGQPRVRLGMPAYAVVHAVLKT